MWIVYHFHVDCLSPSPRSTIGDCLFTCSKKGRLLTMLVAYFINHFPPGGCHIRCNHKQGWPFLFGHFYLYCRNNWCISLTNCLKLSASRQYFHWPNPGSQSAYRMTGSSSSKTNAHVCCYVNKWRING